MRITKRQLLQIIREEKAKNTEKYNDDPALKGDQDKLPDGLQKAIIDKEEEEKNESILRRRLRKIIMKECPGGMHGDPEMPDIQPTANDQMDLAPEPDLDDAHGHSDGSMPCPIKTAAKMKEAGASEAELMDFVNTLIDEFKMGGTTVPESPDQVMHADGPVGPGKIDLLDILGL